MSDTPRTSEEWRRIQRRPDGRSGSEITYPDLAHGMSNFAKQLERELAAVTEQLDMLAEERDELKKELIDAKSSWTFWMVKYMSAAKSTPAPASVRQGGTFNNYENKKSNSNPA